MKKFLQMFALMALLTVPWAATAQSGCTIRVTGTDAYGDGWNGGSLDISQGGTSLSTFTLSSGASGEVSITLPTSDPVTFTWTSGSWDSEVTIYIYDGGNTLVYSVSEPSAGVIYTMSSPCPSCLPATDLTASNVTTDGMTVSWTDASNSGSYTLSYWKTGTTDTTTVNLTTTSYTLTGLDANTLYNFAIITICSATDESQPLNGSFRTACSGSTCDITLQLGSSSSWSSPWSYGATVQLWQDSNLFGSYTSSTIVEVCGTSPIVVKYTGASYSYYDSYAAITILDGGGVAVYSGGSGDTLTTIATPCPSCIPPTALTALPDSTEILFSWTPRSGASQFIVYLNDSLVSDNVTDTFYTFMGLSANTAYTVKVQSVCVAGSDSSAIASRSTRTACGQITLPYAVDFEDAAYNGAWYPCWDSVIHAGTDPSVNDQNSPANHTTGGTYAMYLQGNSSEQYNLVVSPQIPTAGNNIYVRFWARVSSSGWLKAGVMTNPYDSSTFIPLVNVAGNSWNEYEFYTDTLDPAATYYVAWLGHASGFIGKFDDVYIGEIPSCMRVTSFVVDSVSDESISVSWSDTLNSGVSYTVTCASANDTVVQSNITDTYYTFHNLSANTLYTLSVVVNCSSGDAEAMTITERTACGATPIPFSEGFEDAGAMSCWKMVDCASSTGRTTGNANTGNACFRFYYGYNDQYLISPRLAGTDNGVKVEFAYKQGTSYTETFKVGYSTTNDSVNSFVWGEEMTATSSYQTFSAIYPAGTKYVSIRLTSYDQLYLYIDDINFMLPPNCMPVTMLTVDTVTATNATLSWGAGSIDQTLWYVRLGNDIFNVTDSTYSFNNLSPRTHYTAYVAAACSGDTSEWVSVEFITGCANGECEITVASSNDYISYGSSYSSYSPTLHVIQNGAELASVQGVTETIGVCTGMPVVVITEGGSTFANPTATVIDGGDEELFNGSTTSYYDGDTLVYMANACPSCLKPMNLIPAVVDSNEITFTWTVESGITYLVSFDNAAYTTNTTGTYTAYGLNPNTLHTFAVKSLCGVGDTSNPRIVTVKSACGEMAIPYTESFEGDAQGNVPSCWTVVSAGANGFPAVDDNGHTGSHSLTFVSNTNNTAMIASSRIPLPGDSIKVSFWAFKDYGTGTLEAGMMTNPYVDSTFISLVTVTASDYAFYEFNTNTLSNDSSYYLAFRYSYTSDYYWAKVDDINISLDLGCMTPTNVTATPDAVNPSVVVTWSNGGALNDFVVQYRSISATTWSAPQYTTSTTKTLSNLAYSTTYEIRVGQLCGIDTLWASSVYATTVCGLTPVPYIEHFESPTGTLPPCWNYTNASYFHWNRWTTHAETSGDGELMVSSGSAGEAAILPLFYAPFIKLQISFKAKLGNVSEGDGIMMGAYDETTSTVDWLDTLTNPNQSRENFVVFTYNYLNYTGSGTRIAIGHSHNNSGDWGFAIDSIVVVELASCNPPENLEAHNTLYPNTADDVYFTWTVSTSGTYVPSEWELYFDTITSTIDIDSVAESDLIVVDTTYYMPPINTLAEGAHYRLFVRSKCGNVHSGWVELQNGFTTDEFWMNNSSTFDTIVGCDFVIYDNGGPVAGYLHNSNSNLVILAGEAGRELQLQGGFFCHGADANTFTVYDGIGTNGTVLYTRNITNLTETIDSVLATSTTGAMTITFTSGYYAALGYELYIHCVGTASCTKPTNLHVEMTSSTTAHATWDSTGASLYRVYHHISGDSIWNMNPAYTNSFDFTGLPVDVNYDFYVVAYCSANDTSAPSIIRHFNTHWVEPCYAVESLQVNSIDESSASLSWTGTGNLWEVAIEGGATVMTNNNSYMLTGLNTNTEYCVKVRTVCDTIEGRYSEWSDTICFTTLATYTLTVTSNNDDWGTVIGGGTYTEGTSVELRATANDGYHFVKWQQDNDTHAVRTVIVTEDATYTATFASNNGIDDIDVSTGIALYPNPASTSVTIALDGFEGLSTISLIDLNGRTMGEWTVENDKVVVDLSGMARGAYFVRVTGSNATGIRKLVVK